jgi:hypothetical protein
MPATPSDAPTRSEPKRGALTGAALTDEVFDSSPSLLRPSRGSANTVAGLQQHFSPREAAELIAAVNGRSLPTLDLTAGDGSLLAGMDREACFGIEIDADQVAAGTYEAIHGDLQVAYPMLRLLGVEFPRVACNPPFGLDWTPNGQRENSTVATWLMANALLTDYGAGAFIAGRDRFLREVVPRPDAAGVYALIECDDLFDGVELPCLLAFFVIAENIETPREGGPLRLSASRAELPTLVQRIRAERERVGAYVPETSVRHPRPLLEQHFETVSEELRQRRDAAASTRQRYDLALNGARISARSSAFARLVLSQRRVLRNVERLQVSRAPTSRRTCASGDSSARSSPRRRRLLRRGKDLEPGGKAESRLRAEIRRSSDEGQRRPAAPSGRCHHRFR